MLFEAIKKRGVQPHVDDISILKGKTLVVDGNLLVNTYFRANSTADEWLTRFGAFLKMCLDEEISLIMVFDGPPQEVKAGERQKRKDRREEMRVKLETLEKEYKTWTENGEMGATMQKQLMSTRRKTKLLKPLPECTKEEVEEQMTYIMDQLRKANVCISHDDYGEAKRVCDRLKIPMFLAHGEGEKLGAFLTLKGDADAILSKDSDCFPLGAEWIVTEIKTGDENKVKLQRPLVVSFKLSEVLSAFQFTFEQFQMFCVLCGTDFNSSIYGMGCEYAFRLVTRCKTREAIIAELDSRVVPEHPGVKRKRGENATIFASDLAALKFDSTWELFKDFSNEDEGKKRIEVVYNFNFL